MSPEQKGTRINNSLPQPTEHHSFAPEKAPGVDEVISLGNAARRPSILDLVISTNCLDRRALVQMAEANRTCNGIHSHNPRRKLYLLVWKKGFRFKKMFFVELVCAFFIKISLYCTYIS